ncbi:MAG: 2-oxo acid dehydrogenase subunit E2 [Gammaproteobacteria bacterium]|nr:2-oxo acid dehydrogenase subunit E2 [Gammaproteobacteria bacterium]
MIETLLLPSLGEGIGSGTIVSVSVEPGARIAAGQPLFDVEADKVSVEIPATMAGEVLDVFVSAGDEVSVGAPLATIRSDRLQQYEGASSAESGGEDKIRQPGDSSAAPRTLPAPRREWCHPVLERAPVPAGPGARRMARELGIAIHAVPGSGRRGRISRQDVLNHARHRLHPDGAGHTPELDSGALPSLSRFGRVERISLDSVQRATARNMARSWREVPHAWLERYIDITELDRYRRHLENEKPSLTSYLVKALGNAMTAYPEFNSSIDMIGGYVVRRHYLDIGVAVDTPRGLVVPVIREVQRRSVGEVEAELKRLTKAAFENQLDGEAFQGAGMTLSNLGGRGIDAVFPLINWPQPAILGIASARWVRVFTDEGAGRQCLQLPVTLAIDHRVLNGAAGVRFLNHLADALQCPDTLG